MNCPRNAPSHDARGHRPGPGGLLGTRAPSASLTGGAGYDTFKVAVHPSGPGRCRVTVAGDLAVVSAPDLRDTLLSALSAHDRVDVDCGQLTFIDCTGLSALLAAAHAAKPAGASCGCARSRTPWLGCCGSPVTAAPSRSSNNS